MNHFLEGHVRTWAGFMASAIRMGASPDEALDEYLRSGQGSRRFLTVVRGVREGVREGELLSEGLGRSMRELPVWIPVLLRCGEEAGDLAGAFDTLARRLRIENELDRKVYGMLVYPVVLVSLAALLGFFCFLGPFRGLAASFETRELLAAQSTWSRYHSAFVDGMFGAAGWGFPGFCLLVLYGLVASEYPRLPGHRFLRTRLRSALAQCHGISQLLEHMLAARMLELGLAGGRPLPEILESMAAGFETPMRRKLMSAAFEMRAGRLEPASLLVDADSAGARPEEIWGEVVSRALREPDPPRALGREADRCLEEAATLVSGDVTGAAPVVILITVGGVALLPMSMYLWLLELTAAMMVEMG